MSTLGSSGKRLANKVGGLPSNLLPINEIAKRLGGDVHGNEILCPGPGHSEADRSLAVMFNDKFEGGFVCHSFADDDAIVCRDYVRQKLGLPAFEKTNGKAKPWQLLREHIYCTEDGKPHLRKRKMLDPDGKRQFPQAHYRDGKWNNGVPAGWPQLLYRLPELTKAPLANIIYVTEGERDCDSLATINLTATTAGGASSTWTPEMVKHFQDRRVVIFVDADAPGRTYGNKVARQIDAVAKSVKIVDLYPNRNDGADVTDFLETDRAGVKLLKLVTDAPFWHPTDDEKVEEDALIAELAALPPLQYEKRREAAAEQLGIRVTVLDKLVAAARGKADEEKIDPSPVLYDHWNVEPAQERVDGNTLLNAIKAAVQRFVFMAEDLAVAVTLWIVFTYLHEVAVTHSPLLLITSAEKDSGKSTLLGVLNFLVRRALQSVDISGPALFRSIAKWQPTLIVDEADDALADNMDLRSVINSGWTRGQGVIRCHPDTREPELFSTFAPKAVGMKGRNLPDTTLSRSIVITMKPRRSDDPKEKTDDFAHVDNETFAQLRSQMMRWAADNAEAISQAKPEIPAGFHNRRRANWVPLLAIAETCGWKEAGLRAAQAIEAVADTFDPSTSIQLLYAIKEAGEARGVDRITSAGLIQDLIADETAPWATWNRGKRITQRQVANLLKPFGIKPGSIKIGSDKTAKGYLFAWLVDAFKRHCTICPAHPPILSGTSGTDLFSRDFSSISIRHQGGSMPDKNDEKDNNSNEVPGCRMKMGGEPERGDGDGMVTGPSLFQIPLSHALRT